VLFGVWYLAGQQAGHENAGRSTDAENMIAELRGVLAQNPADSFARLNLGKSLMKSDTQAALVEFHKVSEKAPEYFDALSYIVVINLKLGNTKQAVQAMTRLEQIRPNDANLQAQLTKFFYDQHDYETALLHAVRRAQLQPENIDAHMRVAEINADLNRHVDMIPPLNRVIELDPQNYRAHINLAHACYKTGLIESAEIEARWCLERNPDETFCYRILAGVARDAGQMNVARQYLKQALQREPMNLDLRILEADLLLYHKQPEQAYLRLKPLYAEHQNKGKFIGAFARAAAAAGHRKKAKQLYEVLKRIP